MKVAPNACVLDADIITGGSCVGGIKGANVLGPEPDAPESERRVCPGDPEGCVRAHNCGGAIDMCGDRPELDQCSDCQDTIPSDAAILAALPATQFLDRVSCSDRFVGCDDEKCTITATAPLNVVEIDSLQLEEECELVLDGQGIPDVVFIVRAVRKFQTRAKAKVTLAGGTLAENVLFEVQARKCDVGVNNMGSGVIFCPETKARIKGGTAWTGAVIAGRSRVELGLDVDLTHQPFFGLAGPAPEVQGGL